MKTTLSLLMTLTALTLCAQNFEWAKQMGGVDGDVATSVTTDANGNAYSTGSFWGTADFDPGAGTYNLSPVGQSDIFISKLTASGSFVWAKQIGGIGGDGGASIAVGASGSVYVAGRFEDTVDFDPGPGVYNLIATGLSDVFVLKLTSSGTLVWAKGFGGTHNDHTSSIALGQLESVHISGIYSNGCSNDPVDLDPGPGTYYLPGGAGAFALKLDSAGTFVWAGQIGTSYGFCIEELCVRCTPVPKSVSVDASGNVHIAGRFGQTNDFDPGTGTYFLTATYIDGFVLKLNSSGAFVWAKQFVSSKISPFQQPGCYVEDITTDGSGNVYTTGGIAGGSVDFDPGSKKKNLKSDGGGIFVSKLNASGNYVWAGQMGGYNYGKWGHGHSIDLDGDNNIYTTGWFYETADFNPAKAKYNLSSAGGRDVFVSKLTSSGSFVSAVRFGGVTDDLGYAIDLHATGAIYTAGSFFGTADFDPGSGTFNMTSAGSSDIFVHKMYQGGGSKWSPGDTEPGDQITLFPNPTSGFVTVKSDTEFDNAIIRLLDGSGRLIAIETVASGNRYDIDLTSMPAGLYFVEVSNVEAVTRLKLLKL